MRLSPELDRLRMDFSYIILPFWSRCFSFELSQSAA